MMTSFLNSLGLIPWFSELIGGMVSGINWIATFMLLSLVYIDSHYLFTSNTAHVSAMYTTFLVVYIAAGTQPVLAALVLGFFSNLFSSMTHYGYGPAPVYFGSGYVDMGSWWKYGALISLINIVIWLGAGTLWWKIIGRYRIGEFIFDQADARVEITPDRNHDFDQPHQHEHQPDAAPFSGTEIRT